ncbi:MAG: YHYH protein, partial [Actinomycetota bacterium]
PPQEAFGDPVYNNLLDSCKGHTGYNGDYHYHAILAMNSCYLDETIIGYANDGFPIYSNPGYTYVSGYKMTGNPKSNSWNAYTYQTGGANTLDECNGRTDDNGNYRYYITESFPYIIGCYKGTPTTQVGKAATPMQMSVVTKSSTYVCEI